MLRSLNAGVSGLRSHQTMLDVTSNNIANVNTHGFKAASTIFQDTMSQLVQTGVEPGVGRGGQNPAQVGLGTQVAATLTDFTQGAAQATGRATDMMISGDGFFVAAKGGDQYYTRAGAFSFDADGQLVTPDGAIVQGWMAVDGQVNTGAPVGPISMPTGALARAYQTTEVKLGGNLPSDAADGTEIFRDIEVFDQLGDSSIVTLAFTKDAGAWSVKAGAGAAQPLTFTATGQLSTPTSLAVGGVNVDIANISGYAGLSTVQVRAQDGGAAGTLDSFFINPDGTLVGAFSNGSTQVLGQLAVASFDNAEGLEKAGNSLYSATPTSGNPQIGVAGQDGLGTVESGSLEMSNVDLSLEFTRLITAQRGFQASARTVTTSDEILGEVTNLKR